MKPKPLDLEEFERDLNEFLTPQEFERLMSFLRKLDFPLLPIDGEIVRKLRKQADGRLRENLLEIKQQIKTAIQGLMQDINKLDYDMMLGEDWEKHEWARSQEFMNFVLEIKKLIKKWFPLNDKEV